MLNFTGQNVLITGAGGNLGQAVAEAFWQAGANLILVERRPEKLQETFANWLDTGRVWLASADVTDEDSVNQMVATVLKTAGRVDVLVNVAGGFVMGPPLHETETNTWDFMLNLNSKSVFLTSKALVPHMLANGRGKIVNISARAGLEGKGKMIPYTVSKAAVIRLTEGLAAEVKDKGINVNCVLPGTIDTVQNRAAMPQADTSKWVPPADLANVVLFLASDLAKAVHGAAIPVYGLS